MDFYILVGSMDVEREGEAPELAWVLLQHDAEDAQELMEEIRKSGKPWTPPGMTDPLESLEVQGYELPCGYSDQSGMPKFAPRGANPSVGPEDGPAVVLLLPSSSGEMDLNLFVTGENVEQVTPEDIKEFLSNFELPAPR